MGLRPVTSGPKDGGQAHGGQHRPPLSLPFLPVRLSLYACLSVTTHLFSHLGTYRAESLLSVLLHQVKSPTCK